MKQKKDSFDILTASFTKSVKCKHCNKTRWDHRATDGACPFGQKDRTGGYSFPNNKIQNVRKYEPIE